MNAALRAGIAVALGIAIAACSKAAPTGAQGSAHAKTKLLLLTSLPITFGEGFGLDDAGSPLLAALEKDHEVVPIDVSDPASLAKGRVLLAAQPRAQTAENLVALDQWVRDGGRVVLLADPRLERHSDLPLGDKTRAMPMFADTGLLAHWGLRLDAPDRPGPVEHDGVTYVSPGRLVATGDACVVAWDELSADCALGKGRAIVIADADFLGDGKEAAPPPEALDLLDRAIAKALGD